MPAARWALGRWPPAPSSRRTSPPPPRALGWMLAEWIKHGKPSVLGGISGAVAGLVAITPASGFVKPMPALLIGLLAGLVCYFMVAKVKNMFGYDDSLDAFGVHGVGGTLGAILTGVFATNAVNDALKDAAGKVMPLGLVDGNGGQMVNQIDRVGDRLVLAIVGTFDHPEDLRYARRRARRQQRKRSRAWTSACTAKKATTLRS